MARRRNKGEERRIAQERIERLVELAQDALREQHPERADRYAELAWRLRLRYQLSGTAIDGRICRACHAFLHPGHSARFRLTGGKRSMTCLRCGHVRRRILATRTTAPGPARERGGGTDAEEDEDAADDGSAPAPQRRGRAAESEDEP